MPQVVCSPRKAVFPSNPSTLLHQPRYVASSGGGKVTQKHGEDVVYFVPSRPGLPSVELGIPGASIPAQRTPPPTVRPRVEMREVEWSVWIGV